MFAETRPSWVEQLDEWHLLTGAKIVLIVVLAIAANWVARKLIRRAVAGMHSLRTSIGGRHQRGTEQRARTITAVLRSVAAAVIWAIAIIAVLSLAGVNITAFVAVSSIVGGALAFGAQQIVRDLLAGFFMFTEDQYAVGDEVDLGLAEGTVEQVTLRVTRLRSIDGKVWYVPHGQITRVANLSQEWASVLVDVPIVRDADISAATSAIERAAAALKDDASLGPDLVDDPKVVGVQQVLDDRIVLRLVVKAKPPARLAMGRALQALLVEAVQDGRIPAPSQAGPTHVVLANAPATPATPSAPAPTPPLPTE
jgi:small-conductance mechanosensitive channel